MRPLDDERIRALLVEPGATVRQAMERIDRGGAEIALVVREDGVLHGTLTDGDIRRALLGGADLSDPVEPFVTSRPITVGPGMDRAAALELMRARSIAHLPEVDPNGKLSGVHLLREVIGAPVLPNCAVVIAGGRGTRLGALTTDTPKPMLRVAGRPILERIVLHLVGGGIRDVVLSVGYLAEQIEAHFGDGSEFGCRIGYLREDPAHPLGTGGPLHLLLNERGRPQHPVLVMNGDLLTSFSVSGLLDVHSTAGAAMTIGVKEYTHDVPFGVVHLDTPNGGVVQALEEKPRAAWTVNAGTYILEPHLLERVPAGENYPITELARTCLHTEETVVGWPLEGDWQDIGRPDELDAARSGR